MHALKQAIQYFGIVFAAGFTLAFIRIPFLVPRYGVRAAELIEIPVMLVVIGLAARWLQRRNDTASSAHLLWIGTIAFLLMVAAELVVAVATSDLSLADYVLSKDPVSGTAYLFSLVCFAFAPWVLSLKRGV